MTAAQLAALNGMLAVETAARAEKGDGRDKSVIADQILREIVAPDLSLTNRMLDCVIRDRDRPGPVSRVLP